MPRNSPAPKFQVGDRVLLVKKHTHGGMTYDSEAGVGEWGTVERVLKKIRQGRGEGECDCKRTCYSVLWDNGMDSWIDQQCLAPLEATMDKFYEEHFHARPLTDDEYIEQTFKQGVT